MNEKKVLLLHTTISKSPGGGIGRRARFRCVCRKACRFDSCPGHWQPPQTFVCGGFRFPPTEVQRPEKTRPQLPAWARHLFRRFSACLHPVPLHDGSAHRNRPAGTQAQKKPDSNRIGRCPVPYPRALRPGSSSCELAIRGSRSSAHAGRRAGRSKRRDRVSAGCSC